MDGGDNWRGLPAQVHHDAPGAELPPPPPPRDPANPLPPPPAVPHHGLYLDTFQLANTLRALRAKCQARADNAALAMRLSGVLMLWGSVGFGYVALMMLLFGAAAMGGGPDWYMLYPGGLLGLAYLTYAIVVLMTAGKVFPYHYRLAWQRLIYESDSVLLADEERLRILQDSLPGKFWGSAVVKHHFTNLRDRLEFAAFHLPSLRHLAHHPEEPPRQLMRQTEVSRQYARHFDQQGLVIGCCILSGIIYYSQIIYLLIALLQGPRMCQASARLAAFIDFYLEEPRLDVASLPPPEDPQGWWARTTAPWHYIAPALPGRRNQ